MRASFVQVPPSVLLVPAPLSPGEGKLPPSVSIVVAVDGEVRRERHVGATAESLYHWWSVTKVATALAVLELAEAGRLDLDGPVTWYLPWLAGMPDGAAWTRVTPRMLLTHAAGVRDPVPALFGWIHFPGAPQPPEEASVRRAVGRRGSVSRGPLPLGQARYSNLGYILLGALIEETAGAPYGEALRELVLAPAGMDDTGVRYPPGSEARAVAGSHPRFHPLALLLRFVVRDYRALVAGRRDGRLWFRPVYTDYLASTGLIGPARDAVRLARRWAERAGASPRIAEALAVRLPLAGFGGVSQSTGWQWSEAGFFLHRGGGPGFGAELRSYPGRGVCAFAVGNDTTFRYGPLLDAEVAALAAGRRRVDFDARAAAWDDDPAKRERSRALAEAIRAAAVRRPDMRALEYGSGTGAIGFHLAGHLGRLTLADSSEGMLDVLRRKIAAAGLSHLHPLRLDLETDPPPGERYDLLYSAMTLHHVRDPRGMVARWAGLLAPGGRLVVIDLDREDGSFHGPGVEAHPGFDRDALAGWLREEGLTGVRVSTVYTISRPVAGGRQGTFPLFMVMGERPPGR